MRGYVYAKWLVLLAICTALIGGTVIGAQAHRDYRAQWIWAEVKTPDPFQFVKFRKSFTLDAAPKSATVYITADTFYRLWVNGRLAMYGPARSSAGKATVDPVSVERFLKRGENTIIVDALYCKATDGHLFDALAQAPGFLCQLDINGKCVLATDATWEASECMAWNRQSPRFSYQRGWVEDFDSRIGDTSWKPAVVLGKVGMGPWHTVELRDIPLPATLKDVRPINVVGVQRSEKSPADLKPDDWIGRLEKERLQPEIAAADNAEGMTARGKGDMVLHGDGAEVTYDFGADYAGFIGFELTGKAGQTVEIAWNERLSDRDNTARPLERIDSHNAIRYVLHDGRQAFLGFYPQLARYLRVVLRGDGDLTLHRLGMTEYRFVAPTNGDFTCSDPGLNLVFKAARRTAMLNTVDTFMDCPSRERGAWLHDSYWTAQSVYAMFGDLSVNRRMVRQGGESQDYLNPPGMVQALYPSNWAKDRFIPAHALLWVMQAGLDNRFTGETASTRDVLPAVRRLMDAFAGWRNSDGLLENVPSWNFLDWADIRTDGVCVALNAIYARTLDEAARMERAVGEPKRAGEYERDASAVRTSLRSLCGDGLYYPDALIRNDQKQLTPSRERSESTQYYAMWAVVSSDERTKRMWAAMRDDFVPTPDHKVQPIQGLTRGGLYSFPERVQVAARLGDYAAVIRDIRAMFLPMAQSAPGTLWEQPWSVSSLCHGFASMAAPLLMEESLGIRLDRPMVIAPHGGGVLKSCQGYITTPQGRVAVGWKQLTKRYELRVSLPKGISAEVRLPDEARSIWQSGPPKDKWREQMQVKGHVVITVEAGALSVN